MSLDTAILIPSYSSNPRLQKLINQIKDQHENQIIVVDDGSPEPVELEYNDISLIQNESNRGKGLSLKRGFDFARQKGFSHVVTMDSDLQHDPLELATFLDSNSDLDFVLGYRERNKDMPILRKFSNWTTSRIISKLTGVDVLDSQCGYRRYSLEAIDEIEFIETGFQFESEVLIKGLREESKIEQVKISTIYDKDNKSYIKHFSDTLKFIQLILRSILRK
jgi:glycosyltransferase involved in cell wall biosynthesis